MGDAVEDHECWIRPENMETRRSVLVVDEKSPASEIAAETSAAMASSSLVFKASDHPYARSLLNKAKMVFLFFFFDDFD